jgi:hypothetical protein
VKASKISLETVIEAKLKDTGNWPQPPWVLAAMAEDLRIVIEKVAGKRINSGYVLKIYGRKSPAQTEGGESRQSRQ